MGRQLRFEVAVPAGGHTARALHPGRTVEVLRAVAAISVSLSMARLASRPQSGRGGCRSADYVVLADGDIVSSPFTIDFSITQPSSYPSWVRLVHTASVFIGPNVNLRLPEVPMKSGVSPCLHGLIRMRATVEPPEPPF